MPWFGEHSVLNARPTSVQRLASELDSLFYNKFIGTTTTLTGDAGIGMPVSSAENGEPNSCQIYDSF